MDTTVETSAQRIRPKLYFVRPGMLPQKRWEQRLARALEYAEPVYKLWAGVLNYAIRDLESLDAEIQLDAREWFAADADENVVGSFAFICLQLGFDYPAQIRADVLKEFCHG